MWAFKLLAFVSVVAVTLAGTPQWQNPRYSFSGHIPHFLPKAAPSMLLRFPLVGEFYTGPTIDEKGNTFWVRSDGVYHWSPVTNNVTGPFLKDSVYANNLQHAVISSDSKTLFLRWTNTTGGIVTRGVVPSENTAAVVAVDVATMLAGSLSDTASVKWVWGGQVTSDIAPSSYLSMWVEGDYVIVAYNRARVALIHASSGASMFDVDTAAVTPLLSESQKYKDNRVFPHPDGVHFYWLRYDGILFRVNRDNQQVNFIDLVGGLESAAWEHCTITTDATGSVIYGLNYAYEYNDTFAIEPDLSAIRWIGNVAYGGVAYGSGMLDIGGGLLALATDGSYEIVRASDGSSVGANISYIYGSESTFLYNPAQHRLLLLSIYSVRTLYAISTSEFAKIEWTLLGDGGVARAGGAFWDFSAPVAVDATGRIIVTGTDFFYVFGCPFGQAVNATGDCSDTCPDGFMMEDNTCVAVPPVVAPVAAPSNAPVAAPSDAPVAIPVADADDAPIGLPTGGASSVVPFASLAACVLALLSIF